MASLCTIQNNQGFTFVYVNIKSRVAPEIDFNDIINTEKK
jgi:hypothetical protein